MTRNISSETMKVPILIFLTISILSIAENQLVSAQFFPYLFPPRGSPGVVGGGNTGAQPPSSLLGPPPFSSFNPMMSPYGSSFNRPIRYRPRPASPAKQCRKRGACRELEHGTTLAMTWQSSSAATTIPPSTTAQPRQTASYKPSGPSVSTMTPPRTASTTMTTF